MICDSCGYYNPDNYSFCNRCGKKLNKKSGSTNVIDQFRKDIAHSHNNNIVKNEDKIPTNKPRSSRKLFIVGIVILLLLIVSSASTLGDNIPFMYGNSSDESESPIINNIEKLNTYININQMNTTVGNNISLTAEITDENNDYVPNGLLSYSIDDTQSSANINNGKAIIQLNNLSSGTHSLYLAYPGSNYYYSSENSTSINVRKINTNLTGNITDNGEKLEVILVDEANNPIENADINVISEDNTTFTNKTNNDGKSSISLDLTPENHELKITYYGNQKYNQSEINIEYVVVNNDSHSIKNKINEIKNDINNIKDNITNSHNKTDNNTAYNNTTEYNNTTKNNTNNTNRSHENTNFTNNTANDKINTSIHMDYDNDNLIINLTDENKTQISDADIKIVINNTQYNTKTDENGSIIIPLDDVNETLKIEVIYDGNSTFNPSNITRKIVP